jgi:hypothetical protein
MSNFRTVVESGAEYAGIQRLAKLLEVGALADIGSNPAARQKRRKLRASVPRTGVVPSVDVVRNRAVSRPFGR